MVESPMLLLSTTKNLHPLIHLLNFFDFWSGSGSPVETNHHIVILWRKDQNHLKYEWLEGGWEVEPEKHNTSREVLKETVQRLLHSNQPMTYETVVQVRRSVNWYRFFLGGNENHICLCLSVCLFKHLKCGLSFRIWRPWLVNMWLYFEYASYIREFRCNSCVIFLLYS